jgi:hypothetical protein
MKSYQIKRTRPQGFTRGLAFCLPRLWPFLPLPVGEGGAGVDEVIRQQKTTSRRSGRHLVAWTFYKVVTRNSALRAPSNQKVASKIVIIKFACVHIHHCTCLLPVKVEIKVKGAHYISAVLLYAKIEIRQKEKFLAAISAMVWPMLMEAVAAGEGALSTWIICAASTMLKSSNRAPLGASACARTPEPEA